MEHIERIKSMKSREKIVMLTAYDYCNAKILDSSGIDIILVGDSLGMVVLGYKSTREVTMEDMLRHTKAVANGSKNTLIVADLPYNSDITPDDVVRNARLLLANGAGAVKPEGKPELPEGRHERFHGNSRLNGEGTRTVRKTFHGHFHNLFSIHNFDRLFGRNDLRGLLDRSRLTDSNPRKNKPVINIERPD